MKIFYFTSTGNSLYVSKKIKENFEECDLVKISRELDEVIVEDEKIGIVYPLHSFGLPIIVEEFIKKMKFNSNPYIFVVQVTGGGKSNNGFYKINEILKKKGVSISNYEEVKYISNYIRAGRNPSKERAIKAIEDSEEKLNDFIENITLDTIKEFKKRKNHITFLIHDLWRDKYKKRDKNFNVNDDCINCGLCIDSCPSNNIEIVNGKVKFNGHCVDCMGCINICPKNAINIGNSTIRKDRYLNPFIKRDELIK